MSFQLTPTSSIFVASYNSAWDDGQFLDYNNLQIDPASAILSYGLSVFDGLKAHRTQNGSIALFRADDHARRLAKSAEALLMPSFPINKLVEILHELVRHNIDHLPTHGDGSLYIRPQLFADEPCLGIKPCTQFKLVIYCSHVGDYFKDCDGLKIKVLQQPRVTEQMVGNAKAACNYASCLPTVSKYKQQGFNDVLFCSSKNSEHLTETSGSNLFVLLKDKRVLTPPVDDQILPGVTRDSVITLLKDRAYRIEETPVSIPDLINGTEVFFTGTAWSVVGASELSAGKNIIKTDSINLSRSLQKELSAIKTGVDDDKHRWLTYI
jgi:branched-chain amino acid aminotransferase